jgi:hypothetical protein
MNLKILSRTRNFDEERKGKRKDDGKGNGGRRNHERSENVGRSQNIWKARTDGTKERNYRCSLRI